MEVCIVFLAVEVVIETDILAIDGARKRPTIDTTIVTMDGVVGVRPHSSDAPDTEVAIFDDVQGHVVWYR